MSATASASLELVPPQELAFTLSAAEATPRVTLTLKHPGATQEALAFKVTIRHGALQSHFRLSTRGVSRVVVVVVVVFALVNHTRSKPHSLVVTWSVPIKD